MSCLCSGVEAAATVFFSLVTLSLNNIWGNLLYRCRRFVKKVFKYVTEIALAYWVLEPLHFSCKIDKGSKNPISPISITYLNTFFINLRTGILGFLKLVYIPSKVCLGHNPISGVCSPIPMKFGINMGLWTLITGKLLWCGYLGNGCHGDQIAFSEL